MSPDPAKMTEDYARAVAEATRQAAEAAARHAERVKELEARYGRYVGTVEKATKRNRELAASLKDSTYARHASQLATLNREYATLERQAHLTNLVTQHGRFGAVVRDNAAGLLLLQRAAGGVLGATVAMGVGLARSGFAGTVQGYRLEYAWLRLSRQLAAVAIPAIEKLAGWIGKAAGWFERLSGTQQDSVLKFGLLAAGALAFGGALRTVVAVGGAVVGILRTIGATAGIAGAAAGVGVAGAALATAPVAAGGVGAGSAVAAGAGAGLLSRFGAGALAAGIPMAIGATAAATGYRSEILGGGALYGAARGVAGSVGPMGAASTGGMLKGALRGAGKVALPLAAGIAAYDAFTGGFYSTARDRGSSKFTAGATAAGLGVLDTLTFGFGSDWFGYGEKDRKKAGVGMPDDPRRDITPLQVAQEEAGGAHFRIQEEFLRVDAARLDEEREKKEREKALKESIDKLTAVMEKHADGMGMLGPTADLYAEHMRRLAREARK